MRLRSIPLLGTIFLPLVAACSTAGPIAVDGGSGGDVVDGSNVFPGPDATAIHDAAPSDATSVSVDGSIPGVDASACGTTPCDIIDQCGCAAGEACDLASADPLSGNECRALSAGGTETSSCSTPSDCAAGFSCIGDGSGGAACKPYCDPARGDAMCEGPRGQCVIQLSSGGTEIPGAVMCSSNCDPTDSAAGGCPAGTGCFLYIVDPDGTAGSGDEVNIVDCETSGAGTQDDFCFGYDDCAPEHLCLNTGLALNQCLRICDNVSSSCAAEIGKSCTGFTTPATVGGTEYGVCF